MKKTKKKKTKSQLKNIGSIFQIIGGISSGLFVLMSVMGVIQTQFPSVVGIEYTVTSTPFKVILYFSFALVAVLSFMIAYVIKKQERKRR